MSYKILSQGLALICLCFVLSAEIAWSAQPYQPVYSDPVLESWRWRSFSQLDGVGLRCMVEDTQGNMWFGTDEGVQSYNGVDWTVYTPKEGLLGSPVNVLCASENGSVFAGTERGISCFRDGVWRWILPSEGDLPWPIYCLTETPDGSIWAGTYVGVLRIQGESVTIYTSKDMALALEELVPKASFVIVPDEALPLRRWSGTVGIRFASAWTNGTLRGTVPRVIWELGPNSPAAAAGLQVGDRILTANGNPFRSGTLAGSEGTSTTLMVRRDPLAEPLKATLYHKQIIGTHRDFRVRNIYADRDGNLWFGLDRGQILYHRPVSNRTDTPASTWRLYTSEDGLSIGSLPYITQTQDGVIWTVSNHGGRDVNRFDGQVWTTFRLPGSHINNAILETRDGVLWIGGYSTLFALRDTVWIPYRSSNVPTVPSVRVVGLLEASDGALWMMGLGQKAVRMEYAANRWTTYNDLKFQCETPNGSQWFLSSDDGIIRYDGETWTRYGVEDGLMDRPRVLIVTREGVLWAAGSHNQAAATASFDGTQWFLKTHPQLCWGIETRSVFEAADGTIWFSAADDRRVGELGGVLRFDPKVQPEITAWTHYAPPEVPSTFYSLGQLPDGRLWGAAVPSLIYDGQAWVSVREPEKLVRSWTHVTFTDTNTGLWVGTRSHGAFYYDGQTWIQHSVQTGLADNSVKDIIRTADGSIWAATDKGISRFDGATWTSQVLPTDFIPVSWSQGLRQSRDGALWINRDEYTIRYELDAIPPETEFTQFEREISHSGINTLGWQGTDVWDETDTGELQYAWRLNGGAWSVFSIEKTRTFSELHSGEYVFEVKARDRDFNEDPTPATIAFTVVPPVWKQPWFIGIMVVLLGTIGLQTGRVVRRDRRLQEANTALSGANKELFSVNIEIQKQTERKSAFLASMSHELRTPITSMKGYVDNILDGIGGKANERHERYLKRVTDNATHLLNLVNDLLDLSKIQAGRMDVDVGLFSVKFLIESCCDTVEPLVHSGVTLVQEVADGADEANTDETKLRHVVGNLLSNAVKFTEAGEIAVRAKKMHDQLVVVVSDTGIGMPQEALDTIFDEFQQVEGSEQKQKGTGLGLAISKQYTELLGGTISVASEIGKGTTFTVQVPAVYKGV